MRCLRKPLFLCTLFTAYSISVIIGHQGGILRERRRSTMLADFDPLVRHL